MSQPSSESPCYEIVTYRVRDAEAARRARETAMAKVSTFPGFLSWTALTGADDARRCVDLVAWRDLAAAQAAARTVSEDPGFAAFRESIESLEVMNHYVAETAAPLMVVPGDGIELGTFRLKPGVEEAQMRQAYARMVGTHLAKQPGWKRQVLVQLDDGLYADLALADSRARSETICAGWAGQPDCDAFLALIEAEDMRFGSLLSVPDGPT